MSLNLKALHALRGGVSVWLFAVFAMFALLAWFASTTAWAAPAAGTQITNRARATFTDTATGLAVLLDSNIVSAVVAQQAAFQLTSPQTRVSAPGASVLLPHTVTNTGNGADTFGLSLINTYAGSYAFTSVQLFADANSDGVPDGTVPVSSTPALAPGQAFNFIVVAQIPTSASIGQQDRVTVVAQSGLGGVPVQLNQDIVTVTNNAVVSVTKSFSLSSGPSPQSGLVVTLAYSNIGNNLASNVVLRDTIGAANATPAYNNTGLSYVAGSARWQSLVLSDGPGGDPAGVTYAATTVAGVTSIVATINSVPANSAGQLSFLVDVKPGLAAGIASTSNAAALNYFDGALSQSAVSNNTAYYRVLSAGPDLTLTKTHAGDFTVGSNSVFTLRVNNAGAGPTTAPLVITDTMPAGLQVVSSALPVGGAAGWSCSAVGQIVTCSSPVLLAAGQAHPNPLLLTVMPTRATGNTPIINTAVVSGGGESSGNLANNSANDSLNVLAGASVSGRAWYDLNHNRRLDGEPAAVGIVVELRDVNNFVVAQTLTDANGQYLFTRIQPGSGYKIIFRAPGGNQPLVGWPVNGEQGSTSASSNAVLRSGVLEGLTLTPGANVLEQSLPLDPSGVIYDASTRQPVAGAVVSISGPAGFDPVVHLVGGVPNVTQTTGILGFYQYLLMPGAPSGIYSLAVTPPAGYRSGVAASLPKSASIECGVEACLDPTGLAPPGGTYSVQPANLSGPPPLGQDTTYFVNFSLDVSVDPNVVNNHIPLDPISAALPGLLVEKSSGRAFAEIGEMVPYTVRIRNAGRTTFPDLELVDVLPAGFRLVPGSVRLGLLNLPDPVVVNNGSVLRFRGLGNLPADALLTITYVVRLGVAAPLGDGINRAQAFSSNSGSNIATAKVKVNGGVFSDRGIVLGKIFVDCNHNRQQDAEELGIPGVRIFLQDGSYVVSDSEGKYSFAGLPARTQVLKVDRTTLPPGAKLASISNRHALDGGSRFVDLKNGELQRADFAEFSCSTEVLQQVKARRAKAEVFSIESERLLAFRLDPEGRPVAPADPRVLPASGIVGLTPGVQAGVPVVNGAPSAVAPSVVVPGQAAATTAAQQAALPSSNLSGFGLSGGEEGRAGGAGIALRPLGASSVLPVTSAGALELLLNDADNSLAFLDFKDGDTLPFAQTNVRIKGNLGTSLSLKINGQDVAADRVGTKAEVSARKLQYREYVGLTLKPGSNQLLLIQSDGFGNERGRVSINLIAPDQLGRIEIRTPKLGGIADGRTAVTIEVRLTDHKGVPVTVRTPLTLEASAGRWRVIDRDPGEPGIQTFIAGGRAEFELQAPLDPMDAVIRVSSGILKDEKRLPFLPELRPLIGVGVIEGIINARSFSAARLQQARARDGFEQELNRVSRESGDGRNSAAARSAFFLKGKVQGEYLLTMSYDSDKDVRERLFRDISPNEFYPVYGDSAIRGFDAQSTSRLYVRVDKNKSYLLWGDFTTATLNPTQRLTQYQRSLTGLKHHYETDDLRLDSFASRDSTRQVIREVPANGTSGPFEFALGETLVNSERVELITRDRNQPGVIIRTVPLVRFSDYEFEPLTSRLLMRQPVASVDPFLNPISIRITAEVDQGGETFWVYGVNGQARVAEGLWLGGTYIRNGNPIPESFSRLTGANLRYEVTPKSVITAELANTLTLDGRRGNAERVEWQHESATVRMRAWAGRANIGFDNPASTLNKGREEAGARLEYLVRPGTVVAAEALHSRDIVSGAAREGVLLNLEQAVTDRSKVEIGIRRVTEHVVTPLAGAPADTEITSVRAKGSSQIPGVAGATAYGEYEQDIRDSNKKLLAIGGDYQFATRGKLYARHEFVSSLQGAFALNGTLRQNTTVFGIATDYMNNGSLFSEYRGRDSLGQRTTEAAIGLKNFFMLTEGLRLNTNVERITPLSGSTAQESLALAGGLDYTASELWKGSTRLEFRDSQTSRSWLQTAGVAMKIDRNWTVLGKHILNTIQTKEQAGSAESDRRLQRTQLGLAFRETDRNRWNGLAMVEKKVERDDALTALTNQRDVSIFSTHVNYQPARTWVLNGRYASKWVNESVTGVTGYSFAQLLSARASWDFTERWDASVISSVLIDRASGSRRRGLGLELGYLMQDNLWLSFGFNVFGYRDRDLATAEPTDRGLFLRLRFKFDEDLFARPGANHARADTSIR
jgi:large repetitive protein